jgi:hypothetical protein
LKQAIQERRRKALAAIGFAALVLLSASCGSDDDQKSGPCDSICDCVVSTLGNEARQQCNTECAEALRSPDPHAECEARLDANGVGNCKSLCPAATAH